jgi:hypothetical protein
MSQPYGPSRPVIVLALPFFAFTGGSLPGLKRQGREADQSPPTSAEVNKIWIYTSTPPYALMA